MAIPTGFGVIEVRYTQTTDSDVEMNTFGVEISGDPAQVDLDDFYTEWKAAMGPYVSVVVIGESVTCRFNNGAGEQVVDSTSMLGVEFGEDTNDVIPSFAAYIIQKGTAVGGRKNRGRVFVPGVVETRTELNGVSPTTQGAMNTDLAAFLATAPWGNISGLVILHADASTPTGVTTLACRRNLAVMRNRYQN